MVHVHGAHLEILGEQRSAPRPSFGGQTLAPEANLREPSRDDPDSVLLRHSNGGHATASST
jgi:hypothetical protein